MLMCFTCDAVDPEEEEDDLSVRRPWEVKGVFHQRRPTRLGSLLILLGPSRGGPKKKPTIPVSPCSVTGPRAPPGGDME